MNWKQIIVTDACNECAFMICAPALAVKSFSREAALFLDDRLGQHPQNKCGSEILCLASCSYLYYV